MLTSVAVMLIGLWLIIDSQQHVSATLTLIFGVAAAVLAALDVIGWRRFVPARTQQPPA